MAFTWEVEALRKIVDAIVEQAKSGEKGKESFKQFNIDQQTVEDIKELTQKRSPAIDAFMSSLSKVPLDEAKRRELEATGKQMQEVLMAPKGDEEWLKDFTDGASELMVELAEEAGYDPDLPWFKGEKPTLSEIKEEARRMHEGEKEYRIQRDEINKREAAELAAYEEYGTLPSSGPQAGRIPVDRRRFLDPKGPKESEAMQKFREHLDPRSDLKLDWVNEILKEFPADKVPEVLRLPQWKDEEKKPDMSPFLSYLLSQSPYARLPAAGLLGLGLMGYSKPAY